MAGEKVEGQGEETLEEKAARLEAENLQHKERQKGFDATLKEFNEGRRIPQWAQDLGITSLDDPRLKAAPAAKEPEPKDAPVDPSQLMDEMGNLDPVKLAKFVDQRSAETVSRRSAERQAVDEKTALEAMVASVPETQRALAKSFLNETPVNPVTGRKDYAARAAEFANLTKQVAEKYVADLAEAAKRNADGEPPPSGGSGGSPRAGQEGQKPIDLDTITDSGERRKAMLHNLSLSHQAAMAGQK